jgi:hypothetical protein
VIHTAKASGRELWVEGSMDEHARWTDGALRDELLLVGGGVSPQARRGSEGNVRRARGGPMEIRLGVGQCPPFPSPPWPSQPGRGTFASFCGGSLAPAHRNAGQETEDQGVVDDRPPSTSDFDGPPAPAELLFLLAWVSSVWDSSLIADEPPCSARCDLHVSHSCLHVWLV